MGVSYKLLYEEEEPQAISVDMTRACIEVRTQHTAAVFWP